MSPTPTKVTVGQIRQWVDDGQSFAVVDARNPVAWGASKVKAYGAIRLRLDDPDSQIATLPRDRPLVVYCTCRGEAHSARVASILARQGFTAAYLQGGFAAWLGADLPLERR